MTFAQWMCGVFPTMRPAFTRFDPVPEEPNMHCGQKRGRRGGPTRAEKALSRSRGRELSTVHPGTRTQKLIRLR